MRPSTDRWFRVLLGVWLAVGLWRAGLLAVYAAAALPAPWPTAHLEGASVHFAWRAEHGLELYPPGDDYPYVVNLMGPCGFWIVGGLGRLVTADIATLYLIGRLVSFGAALATAALAGAYIGRRYGTMPGLVAAVCALGAAPMIGYAVMTRPDMLADLAGAAGFLLACRHGTTQADDEAAAAAAAQRRAARVGFDLLAVALLAAACLTKQTAAAYAVAAVAALAGRGRRELLLRALPLATATAAIVLLPVAALALSVEPNIASGLFGQGAIPWSGEQCLGMMVYLMRRSPELLWFAMVGTALWLTPRYRNRDLAILALVLVLVAVVTCGKRGSDLNYFLSLRVVAALAAGTLYAAVVRPCGRLALRATLVAVSLLSFIPSTLAMATAAGDALRQRREFAGKEGASLLDARDRLARLAADPSLTMLTDDDQLAVWQGSRAAILDAYLFRLRVEGGAVDPAGLVERIRSGAFDVVVLSADVDRQYPENFFWRLPDAVADAIRRHYRFSERCGPWRLYVPRDD